MAAVLASLFCALMGRPVEAERWADAVDRWQYRDPVRPGDPSTGAWAAVLRTFLCRHGAEQMRADADEAVRRFAAQSFVTPAPAFLPGIARVLCGDLDGGDASLRDGVSVGEEVGAHEDVALALCERSLVAMARGEWDRAEILADQARAVLRRAGIAGSYATPLVSAVQARAAMHRGDVQAARQQLVFAQRQRPLLTYALPYFAVQARIELIRAHLALADLAAARTLMREADELLGRRPDPGNLAGEAGSLRARLLRERGSSVLGAPALTGAELRLLPMLATHLPFPLHHQVGGEVALPEAGRLHPEPGGHPVPRAGAPGGMTVPLSPHQGDETQPGPRWNGVRRRAERCGPDGEIPGDFAQAGHDRRRLRRRPGRARA